MLTKIKLTNFTVFKSMTMDFSPGINLFIGENGTGKTHIMKVLYSVCCMVNEAETRTLAQKILAVFQPLSIGRLVHRSKGRGSGEFIVYRKDENENTEKSVDFHVTTLNKTEERYKKWKSPYGLESVFIPVKDMLANAPGFRSLYNAKNIAFEEVYADIIDKAFQPLPKGQDKKESRQLKSILDRSMSGKVITKNETFYLKNKNGELEFSLLAEGFRKLGLLYTLISNETLTKGSILFWDEPESNLNPKLSETVVRILLALQEMGVQIFVSTHDMTLLKNFELYSKPQNNILYHSLIRDEECGVKVNSSPTIHTLDNAIYQAVDQMAEAEISMQLKNFKL